jgi:hypothetical protein
MHINLLKVLGKRGPRSSGVSRGISNHKLANERGLGE